MPSIYLSNYRGFSSTNPAQLDLSRGCVALVGPNNSGKSALLRFFYDFRPLFKGMIDLLSSPNALDALWRPIALQDIADLDEVFTDTNDGDLKITFISDPLPPDEATAVEGQEQAVSATVIVSRARKHWTLQITTHSGEVLGSGTRTNWNGVALTYVSSGTANQTISFRRLVRFLRDLHQSIYIGPLRHISNAGGEYYDVNIGQPVVQQWKKLKAGSQLANHRLAMQLETEVANTFGFKSLEINAAENDADLVVFVNKRSYLLRRIGTGLSQFLTVLINLVVRTPTYIFIDEPELNLHPSLQQHFVRSIYSRAARGMFFATHSIGLARDVADLIYSVRRIDDLSYLEEHAPAARLSEVMGEMNYSSLRELGFDRVLLVEGPTEVKTVRAILQLLRKGDRVLIVPLGGGSMINGSRHDELKELIRITGDATEILALIDSERSSANDSPKKEHLDFESLCNGLGIKCHILKWRSMDNYFTDAAIKKVLGNNLRALSPYERLEDVTPRWKKKDNWRIASAMTAGDIIGTDLGVFLSSFN